MNLIKQAFLQARILEHLAVDRSNLLVIDDAMHRRISLHERSADFFRCNALSLRFDRCFRLDIRIFLAAPASPSTSSAALVVLGLFNWFSSNDSRRRLTVLQGFGAFLRRLHLVFALNSSESDLLGSDALRIFGFAFLRFVHYDPLKLFFLIEEVGNIKKRIALETDVNKSRLHTGQHAHYASFVNISDDALIAFAAFNVKLGDFLVFDDRYFLLASVDADY